MAVGLVLVALGCGWVHFASLGFGVPHPAAASSPRPAQPSIHAEHASADRGVAPRCTKLLATTALPGQPVNPAGPGLVVAPAIASGTWATRVVAAGRSPPATTGTIVSGRDLLTRLGIARR